MDAIKNWLQDWSDACVYARECAPDFSAFPLPSGEPFTALGLIAGVCFLVWAINERGLARRVSANRTKEKTVARSRAPLIAETGHNAPA